ncbi:DUF1800 domain-containing protein [Endozoicomonadaceae bacterium StTr2]
MTTVQLDRNQAARFLYQATFGPRPGDVDQLMTLGAEQWLEQQFAAKPQLHLPLGKKFAAASGQKFNRAVRMSAWWQRTIESDDQLRQRMAFALSQVFVAAEPDGGSTEDLAGYYDLLMEHAFGNYRDLLRSITLSPVMAKYLTLNKSSVANPRKNTYPDENYAREVMQLFSIGVWKLEKNGNPVLGADGNKVPAYTQKDVEELARALTGWRKGTSGKMYNKSRRHDNGEKVVLDSVFAAGQGAEQDLEQAVDLLFNHRNTPVFISTLLIKRLTLSNPRKQYVRRVAQAFENNGKGVRGDFKAVLKAILLDKDVLAGKAESGSSSAGSAADHFGKLKEPIIAIVNLARALEVKSNDKKRWWDHLPGGLSNSFGQAPLWSPSVFNFYQPDYAPKGEISESGLTSPEFHILTMGVMRSINDSMWKVIERHTTHGRNGWHWDRAPFEAKVDDPDQYVELLNERFFGGLMSPKLARYLQQMLEEHKQNGYSADRKIRDTLFAVQCSPEFRCQG